MHLAPEGKAIWGSAAVLGAASLIFAIGISNSASLWIGVCGCLPGVLAGLVFRDPQRSPPDTPGAVVAPADGKIIEITTIPAQVEETGDRCKISIFMSLLNVHVNRVPIGGVIRSLHYCRGRFLTAFYLKASLQNEQQWIGIESPCGLVDCVQVAGWLTRRIVCHLKEGQEVATGQRFGMIIFGSRLDLYLPENFTLNVIVGQKVRAGETTLGLLHETN
jgi:phosphatidylserine decarboxylase